LSVYTDLFPGYVVVALRGDLDFCDATYLGRTLSAAASSGSRIIVDLAGLTFIDCSSLAVLASARRHALQAGGDLVLAEPRGPVLRLLSLANEGGPLPTSATAQQAASGASVPAATAWLPDDRPDGVASPGIGAGTRAGSAAPATGWR